MARQAKLSTLEKKAWTACSKYVRTLYCLKTTKTPDTGRCFTCGAFLPIQDLDCGHFIKSTNKDIKFHLDNLRPQCTRCNRFLGGNEGEYAIRLINEIGKERVDYLFSRKGLVKARGRQDFLDLEQEFKNMLKELLEQ